MNTAHRPPPLDGIRVLDCTAWVQGPVATMILADLGAEVIKIEEPGVGDPSRGLVSIGGVGDWTSGSDFFYMVNNRNKKSITLNLKHPEAKEVMLRLVKKSDVLVHNLRVGAAEKLGIDYGTMSAVNPRLVYAEGTGYGLNGPESKRPALDPTVQARTGVLKFSTPPGMPPHYIPGGMGDQVAAVWLTCGVMAALMARERWGIGQRVDSSLLGSMLWLHAVPVSYQLWFGREYPQSSRSQAGNPLYNSYRCRDGEGIFFANLQSDRHWFGFCEALGRLDLATEERFVTAEAREANREVLVGILDSIFATKDSSDWSMILAGQPDLVFERVRSMAELATDPQVLENEYIVDIGDAQRGPAQILGLPVKLEATPSSTRADSAEHGQHTDQVLSEICGYSSTEIGALRDRKVI